MMVFLTCPPAKFVMVGNHRIMTNETTTPELYSRNYTVDPKHIDWQGIVDGLYYPFYMEDCRHKYVAEFLKYDLEQQTRDGINMVLVEYTIRFRRSLKQGDEFRVTCRGFQEPGKRTKLFFEQKIILGDAICTEAVFTATCVPVAGGRPFIPEFVTRALGAG